MAYTIGQVSEMFDLPISTLRYYDKEGFFPDIERNGNNRIFKDREIETIRIIQCLKNTDLELKEIKEFLDWLKEGPSSYEKRKGLFEERRDIIENKITELNKTLALLKYKCWYYEQAIKDGSEDKVVSLLPDKLPKEIQKLYDIFYKD